MTPLPTFSREQFDALDQEGLFVLVQSLCEQIAPMAEEKLSEGLMQSGGTYWPLVTRPMSLVFLLMALAVVAAPLWARHRQRKQRHSSTNESDASAGR